MTAPLDPTVLLVALAGGLLLGLAYFAGLWVTVRRVGKCARPATLLVKSFVVRLLPLLAGLWLASRRGAPALAACLAGFFLARFLAVRVVRQPLAGGKHSRGTEPGVSL